MYRPKKKAKYAVRRDGVLQTRLKNYTKPKVSTDVLPFYRCLLNPIGYGGGGRVPDLAVYPSATAVIDLECNFEGNELGVASGVLILTSNGPRFWTSNNACTTTSLGVNSTAVDSASNTWSGNTTTTGNTLLNGVSSIQSYNDGYRIVGAGLNVEFLGNDANNQGTLVAAQRTATRCAKENRMNYASLAEMQAEKQNYSGAAKNGCYLAWKPADTDDLNYGNASEPENPMTYSRVWYQDAVGVEDTRNYGALHFWAFGLSTNPVPSFRVTIRVHIETLQSASVVSTRGDQGICVNPGAVANGFMMAADKNVPSASKSQRGLEWLDQSVRASAFVGAGLLGGMIGDGIYSGLVGKALA